MGDPFVHLMATALIGKTHDHLRDDHGITPASRDLPRTVRSWPSREWRYVNAEKHIAAHRSGSVAP